MNLGGGNDDTEFSGSDSSDGSELGRVLDAYLAAIESGTPVDPEALAAAHPEIADRLLACISVLKLSSQVAGAEAALDPAAGIRLGDFVLMRKIGQGGMGIVFEARQLSLNRQVALKALPLATALDPRLLSRFQIEARAAAQLHHTNIVPIFSVGFERGVHFYAMQLIEGRTLSALIRDLRQSPQLVASRHRLVAELGLQAAEALEHAHRQGIVHRDVKPSNLMVDVRDNVWITDFGLARMDGDGGLTAQGDVLGTLRYMSPEQSSGDHSSVDHRTDVYSLGATLYELATLRTVHPGVDRDELLHNLAVGEPRKLRLWDRSIPRDLETIILRALNRDREHRYATAGAMADDLRRFLDHRPILARRPSPWRRAERWTRRHKALSASLAFALILAVAGGAVIATLAARNRDLDRVQSHSEYVRDVAQASQYVQLNRLDEAVAVLSRHIPAPGADDERSFPWHYLWRLCHVRPQQLKGHVGDVYHVEYSPDGETLVTAGQDGTIRIWDAATGAALRTFRGHDGDVDCASFSPDGKALASCGDDGTVRLWNVLDENQPSVVLGRAVKEVVSVLFTPDGRTLITGDAGGRVTFRDVGTGREARSLPPLDTRINGMAVSPDGRTLATVAETGARLIEIQPPERASWLTGIGHSNSVVFSHDGRLVAASDSNGSGNVMGVGSEPGRASRLEGSPRFGIEGLAFSADDRILAGCGRDGYLAIWDVGSGRLLRTHRTGRHRLWGVCFSPDGRKLAACGHDGAVEVWNTSDVQDHETILLPFEIDLRIPAHLDETEVTAVRVSPGGTIELVKWNIFDRRTAPQRASLSPAFAAGAWSPDGTKAAVYYARGSPRFEVVAINGQARQPVLETPPELLPDEGKENGVRFAFSADGALLAARIDFRGIVVWDLVTGRLRMVLKDDPGLSLAFSPSANRLAVVDSSDLRILHLKSRGSDTRLGSGIGRPDSIAFTPDGRKLVAGAPYAKALAVWDLDDPRAWPNTLQAPEGPLALAVSPDGKILASGGLEGGVRLVDLTTFHTLFLLDGPREPVRQLRFSSDGLTLTGLSYATSETPAVLTVWTCAPSRRPSIGPHETGSR